MLAVILDQGHLNMSSHGDENDFTVTSVHTSWFQHIPSRGRKQILKGIVNNRQGLNIPPHGDGNDVGSLAYM